MTTKNIIKLALKDFEDYIADFSRGYLDGTSSRSNEERRKDLDRLIDAKRMAVDAFVRSLNYHQNFGGLR